MGSFIQSAEYVFSPFLQHNCKSNCYQILYVTEGSADYIVDKKLYHVVSGQVVFFGPEIQLSALYASSDYKRCEIYVRKFLQHEIEANRKLYSLLQYYAEGSPKILDFVEFQSEIQGSFKRIIKENTSAQVWREDILNLLLQELLMRMYRLEPDSTAEILWDKKDIAVQIQKHIQMQYSKPHTLSELAKNYGISTSYLSHIFREYCGTSPMRYLLDCRIAAAKRYLSKTDRTVNEIMELCGFTDFSNFCRTFKRIVGCTPSQYRQMENKKVPQEGG